MRDYGVTHASGTPTFWRFLLAALLRRRRRRRPRRWSRSRSAARRSRPRCSTSCARPFPRAHVSQVYAVHRVRQQSVRDGEERAAASRARAGRRRRRAVPDRRRRAAGVRSHVGMLGYHGGEATTTGGGPPATSSRCDDDRIRFVGRTSESINVGGVKVHPLAVEEASPPSPGCRSPGPTAGPTRSPARSCALDVVPPRRRRRRRARGRDPRGVRAPAARRRAAQIRFVETARGPRRQDRPRPEQVGRDRPHRRRHRRQPRAGRRPRAVVPRLRRPGRDVQPARTPTQVEAWQADPRSRTGSCSCEPTWRDRERRAAFVKAVDRHVRAIDVLVNNAGRGPRRRARGLFSDDDTDTVIDLNLKAPSTSPSWSCDACCARARAGSSTSRRSSACPATAAWRSTRDQGRARRLHPRAGARARRAAGITVNSVAPGYLRTEMSHGLDEAQLAQIARRTPAGRLGEPEDVAAARCSSSCRPGRRSSPGRSSSSTVASPPDAPSLRGGRRRGGVAAGCRRPRSPRGRRTTRRRRAGRPRRARPRPRRGGPRRCDATGRTSAASARSGSRSSSTRSPAAVACSAYRSSGSMRAEPNTSRRMPSGSRRRCTSSKGIGRRRTMSHSAEPSGLAGSTRAHSETSQGPVGHQVRRLHHPHTVERPVRRSRCPCRRGARRRWRPTNGPRPLARARRRCPPGSW